MDLSIVIPVFNEAKKIQRDIEAAARFLMEEGFVGEIIVVDDGSSDGTARVAQEIGVPSGVQKTVIHYEQNRGKGYATKTGIKNSEGRYVMFADSGLCIPYTNVLKGLDLIKNQGCDVANGSRRHRKSDIKRRTNFLRRILSISFRNVVRLVMGIPLHLTDTQCGFKIYDGKVARELYSECKIDGFLFDIEIILRALNKGYKVDEFPVEWCSDPDTRVLPHHTALSVLLELIQIKMSAMRNFRNGNA